MDFIADMVHMHMTQQKTSYLNVLVLTISEKKLVPTNPDFHNTIYGPLQQLKLTANYIRLALTVKSA